MQSLDDDVADNATPEPEILNGSLSGYLVKVRTSVRYLMA